MFLVLDYGTDFGSSREASDEDVEPFPPTLGMWSEAEGALTAAREGNLARLREMWSNPRFRERFAQRHIDALAPPFELECETSHPRVCVYSQPPLERLAAVGVPLGGDADRSPVLPESLTDEQADLLLEIYAGLRPLWVQAVRRRDA